jgi:TatD DNase family protein
MKFNYFDVHSHLNLSPLFENKDEIINTLRQQGIGTITVGVDYDTSVIAVDLANANPDILHATVGQHPNDNPTEVFDYNKFLELSRDPKVVAIGECGIDYYRLKGSNEEKEIEIKRQKDLFVKHIKLSEECGKPLMIHARPHVNSQDAYVDTVRILEEENFAGHANFHFFVGDIDTAQKIVKHGWSVSYDGPITFSDDYNEVIKWLPIENIMAETDAPFTAPVPYRGQTNYPQYVEFVYKKIAEIKGIEPEIMRQKLIDNANRVFKLGFDN